MLVQTLATLWKDLETARVDLGLPSCPCSGPRDGDGMTAESELLVDDILRQRLLRILENSAAVGGTGTEGPEPPLGYRHSEFPPIGAHFNFNTDGTWFIKGDDKATAAGVSSQLSDAVEKALSQSDIDEHLVKELSQVRSNRLSTLGNKTRVCYDGLTEVISVLRMICR
jgi:hypothetical protein